MKLLALRLCEHDSNFSYWDGSQLHYYKSERKKQIKYHSYQNLWEWRQEIKDVWDVDYSDIDEIVIVIDPDNYKLPEDAKSFFPAVEYEFFPAPCKVWRINHHLAHSLSAWMLTDKDPDVYIAMDGHGDANRVWTVIKNEELLQEGWLDTNGSVGVNMTNAGHYLKIDCKHDLLEMPGKAMGLQSYGKLDQKFLDVIRQYDIYTVDDIFSLDHWVNHHNDLWLAHLQPLDWIRTVHERVGEALLEFFKKFANPTDVISYTGGIAQNVIWNTKLKEYFPNLIIPPHCGDEGLSLGAIEWLRRKHNLPPFVLNDFPFVQHDEAPHSKVTLDTIKHTANLLASGKTVAWYQGHGELGPRALGNRSILMDPRIPEGKKIINNIKKREKYRPFGAVVLDKYKEDHFELSYENPYMLYVAKVKNPALSCITHIDGTCRIQTVKDSETNLALLLEEFYKITGCPVLLNTSLNLAGKPIAGYIDNARELFENSELDVLVVGDCLTQKT